MSESDVLPSYTANLAAYFFARAFWMIISPMSGTTVAEMSAIVSDFVDIFEIFLVKLPNNT